MNRRSLLTGLIGVIAAPAVVHAENLMKVAQLRETFTVTGLDLGTADWSARTVFWIEGGRAFVLGAAEAARIMKVSWYSDGNLAA